MVRFLRQFSFGLAVAACFGAGCSSAPFGSSSNEPAASISDSPNLRPYEPDASDGGYLVVAPEGGATLPTMSTVPQGNPLCNASPYVGTCYPDSPASALGCGQAPEGGP